MTEPTHAHIGRVRGVAIYLSAILGGGLLAMPSLTYRAAGPSSMVAWFLLLALSVPVALTFARLGTQSPDPSGVGGFVTRAFGPRLGAGVSWCFVLALPFGAPSAALIGASYIQGALGLQASAQYPISAGLLAVAAVSASLGLRFAGGVQVALTACLVAVLAMAVVGSLPQVDVGRLQPWAPHGLTGVATATGMLFFSFAGWEAVAPLTQSFRDPRRDVWAVTVTTLISTAVLYLSLSIATITVLGERLTTSDTSVSLLLEPVLGDHAATVTGVLAAVLTFGTTTSYLTGAAHMAAGLARDGWLPKAFATGGSRTPRLGITVIAVMALCVLTVMAMTHADLSQVMTLASAMFIAVTVLGLTASWRLLHDVRSRVLGLLAGVLMAGVLLSCGLAALYPVVVLSVVAIAAPYRRITMKENDHAFQ